MPPHSDCLPKPYRPRKPQESPLYKVVSQYFDEFERVYPERFEKTYGFWRPVIRVSIEKYLKCGDLKEGFARVHCPDCGTDFWIPFSCKCRNFCPSCDKKRAIILGLRLTEDIVEQVPHRQWVFTIPKRLRIFVRFDRTLLGKMCTVAYETVREIFAHAVGDNDGVAGMIAVPQSFGDLLNFHSHTHAIISEGCFLPSGHFVPITDIDITTVVTLWQEKIFALLLAENKITPDVVQNMRQWEHSGFSIDTSVRLEAGDTDGIQRVSEYIARSPLSLGRVVALTDDGSVIYRATQSDCFTFPLPVDELLTAGTSRNFQIFSPLEFLAELTQHIPNKGDHMIHYYGYYSNKNRGMRLKKAAVSCGNPPTEEKPLWEFQKKLRSTWAVLIKCVFEVNPLCCPKCGGSMKIIALIDHRQEAVIQKILKHCGLWNNPPPVIRVPPTVNRIETEELVPQFTYDDDFFNQLVN